jgi:glucosamine 6-phosphate synthetase-like amidotransferase/phosphosugar isomerase protein
VCAEVRALIAALDVLPGLVTTALQQEDAIKTIAEQYSKVEGAYFIGLNLGYTLLRILQ